MVPIRLVYQFSDIYLPPQHIEVEMKWTTFSRRHFQMHFFNESLWISLKISLKYIPNVRMNHIPNIGSDNGLAPTRRQAIIWTNVG